MSKKIFFTNKKSNLFYKLDDIDIKAEYSLIKIKKSKLSRMMRDLVVKKVEKK